MREPRALSEHFFARSDWLCAVLTKRKRWKRKRCQDPFLGKGPDTFSGAFPRLLARRAPQETSFAELGAESPPSLTPLGRHGVMVQSWPSPWRARRRTIPASGKSVSTARAWCFGRSWGGSCFAAARRGTGERLRTSA